jgi:hypothetical protein
MEEDGGLSKANGKRRRGREEFLRIEESRRGKNKEMEPEATRSRINVAESMAGEWLLCYNHVILELRELPQLPSTLQMCLQVTPQQKPLPFHHGVYTLLNAAGGPEIYVVLNSALHRWPRVFFLVQSASY